jgi:hypothetical protein
MIRQWLLCQSTEIAAFVLLIETAGMTGRKRLQAIRLLYRTQQALKGR